MIDNISWFFVALSLLGNVFVVKKNVVGQWIWALSNIGWITINVYQEFYPQAFLFAVYFALCVWGIITWTREAKKVSAAS